MRADLGPLAYDRHVDMQHAPAARGDQRCRMAQELIRRRAFPAHVARREVLADVAGADRAEQGVGDGVERHVGVGMADQPALVRQLDPSITVADCGIGRRRSRAA